MTHHPEIEPLPGHLEQSLQALGGVKAPAELADRVALMRLGSEQAPAELWARVAPVVQAESRPILPFRRIGRIAAAAAVVLAVIIGMNMGDDSADQPGLDYAAYAAQRAEIRAQYLLFEVQPEELSGVARGLAGSLGGALKDGGSL
jgi:hypothetical protein